MNKNIYVISDVLLPKGIPQHVTVIPISIDDLPTIEDDQDILVHVDSWSQVISWYDSQEKILYLYPWIPRGRSDEGISPQTGEWKEEIIYQGAPWREILRVLSDNQSEVALDL